MAIITFMSNEIKETGKTLSLAAIASYMAIEHNYRILIVSTNFNDLSLENCFWEYSKIRGNNTIVNTGSQSANVGLQAGIEGLIKVLNSNRTNSEIIKSYSRIILKDRLDILQSPVATTYQEYSTQITPNYTNILQIANQSYDLIFVDLSRRMPPNDAQNILQISDVVIYNLTQRLKTINDFLELREKNEFYQRKNVMLAIGRYDAFSKYNVKNVTRYLKEKKPISVIPYNTLFFEACSEGEVIDFILRIKSVTDQTDRNWNFISKVKDVSNSIIYKLQELQMKI